jgi:hypothetical protein
MFDAAFSVLCFCSFLWAVWTLGYYFGARHVCERAVEAGHATKTEASDGTHYYFKAVAK